MTRHVAFSFVLLFQCALLLALLPSLPVLANDPATIVRVVDGDTLEITLKGRTEKVRLIGVDTPEKFASDKLHRDTTRTGPDEATIRALGKQTSDFTKSLVHPETPCNWNTVKSHATNITASWPSSGYHPARC